MMRLKIASVAIVLGCISMLSACDIDQIDRAAPGDSPAVAAIGAASVTLIAATSDPCQLDLGDLFWRQHGGEEGYEQRCGHPPPD